MASLSLLSADNKANGAAIALGRACGDEVAPGAGMPGLLNRRPLDGELSLEGPGFDGLSKRKLSQELLQRRDGGDVGQGRPHDTQPERPSTVGRKRDR